MRRVSAIRNASQPVQATDWFAANAPRPKTQQQDWFESNAPKARALAQRIRAKYPGAYDDMDDLTLEKKILADLWKKV